MLNKELLSTGNTNKVLYSAQVIWGFANKHSASTKTFTYNGGSTALAIKDMYQCCIVFGGQDTDFYFFPGYTGENYVHYTRQCTDSSFTMSADDFSRAKWLDDPSDVYSLVSDNNGVIGGITDTGSFKARVQNDYDDSNAWFGLYYNYWAREGEGLWGSVGSGFNCDRCYISFATLENQRIAKFGSD